MCSPGTLIPLVAAVALGGAVFGFCGGCYFLVMMEPTPAIPTPTVAEVVGDDE